MIRYEIKLIEINDFGVLIEFKLEILGYKLKHVTINLNKSLNNPAWNDSIDMIEFIADRFKPDETT